MAELKYDSKTGRLLFTKEMKKDYGYKSELQDTCGPENPQTGLKNVHNHPC